MHIALDHARDTTKITLKDNAGKRSETIRSITVFSGSVRV